jgi:drug/metabolite transporter (DMT)-like permease
MISVSRASSELILATIFWGFGFVGAMWALQSIGPFWMTGLRFLLAFFITLPFMLLFAKREKFSQWQETCKLSFWPGVYLTLTIVLQTWGLKYTTATNAGFITTLYVVFVPILGILVSKKRLDLLHLTLVLMAVVGTALICRWDASNWNKGDILTLGCAMAGALHIVCISHYSAKIKSPFYFNNFQSLWAGSLAFILAIFTESFHIKELSKFSVTGFAFLLFGSTLFGFWAQVRAQRVLSANSASLICLMESPFAGVFAYIFLNERLAYLQWLGAGLIMLAAFSTIVLEKKRKI